MIYSNLKLFLRLFLLLGLVNVGYAAPGASFWSSFEAALRSSFSNRKKQNDQVLTTADNTVNLKQDNTADTEESNKNNTQTTTDTFVQELFQDATYEKFAEQEEIKLTEQGNNG